MRLKKFNEWKQVSDDIQLQSVIEIAGDEGYYVSIPEESPDYFYIYNGPDQFCRVEHLGDDMKFLDIIDEVWNRLQYDGWRMSMAYYDPEFTQSEEGNVDDFKRIIEGFDDDRDFNVINYICFSSNYERGK